MKCICDHSIGCDCRGCEHIRFHNYLELYENGDCGKAFCLISQCDVKCLDIRKKKLENLEVVFNNNGIRN